MARANDLVDTQVGSGTVGSTLTVLVPYTDLARLGAAFVLWVTNHGPDPVYVQFSAAYDGATPDMDTLTAITVPAGQAGSLLRSRDVRRYWSIAAWSTTPTPCSLAWGITVDCESG